MSRPSSGRDANRDCDFSVAIFQILPATSILANLHSKLLGYSPRMTRRNWQVRFWLDLYQARSEFGSIVKKPL
jgi:hypothetical protein